VKIVKDMRDKNARMLEEYQQRYSVCLVECFLTTDPIKNTRETGVQLQDFIDVTIS